MSLWVGLVLLAPAAGCRFVSTPISRILRAPEKFQGLDVTVEGVVEAARWIPDVGAVGFRLMEGADSLLVLTTAAAPPTHQKVRLLGTVVRRFPVQGQDRVVLFYQIGPGNGEAPSRSDTR